MRLVQGALAILAAGILTGCNSIPHRTYALGPLPAQPSPEDLQQADYYREVLPAELWLAPSQVIVEPAPGRAVVTVSQIQDETVQLSLVEKVRVVNAEHPLKPVWLEFQ